MSDVYYKIIRKDGGLAVVCLQDFDEPDYDQRKFLSQYKYSTEEEAEEVINGIKCFIVDKFVFKTTETQGDM